MSPIIFIVLVLPYTYSLCHQNVFFDAYADDRGILYSTLADSPFHPNCPAVAQCVSADIELGANWRITKQPPYQIRLFCNTEQFVTADGIAYWFIDNGLNVTYLLDQLIQGDKNTFRPRNCRQQILIEHVPCGVDEYLNNVCLNGTHCVTIQDLFDIASEQDETTFSVSFIVDMERLICVGLFIALVVSIIVAIVSDNKTETVIAIADDQEVEHAIAKVEESHAVFDDQKCDVYCTQRPVPISIPSLTAENYTDV